MFKFWNKKKEKAESKSKTRYCYQPIITTSDVWKQTPEMIAAREQEVKRLKELRRLREENK